MILTYVFLTWIRLMELRGAHHRHRLVEVKPLTENSCGVKRCWKGDLTVVTCY